MLFVPVSLALGGGDPDHEENGKQGCADYRYRATCGTV
jgi:hypothetical protein